MVSVVKSYLEEAMKIFFDIDKLQRVADDFFYATGIGIYIIAGDLLDVKVRRTKRNQFCNAIRSVGEGRHRCECSDNILFEKCKNSKKPEMHIFHPEMHFQRTTFYVKIVMVFY